MTFPGYTTEALTFLNGLKANNTREWFAENKKVYEAEIREPTKIFTAELADRLEQMTGDSMKSKIFRINRDIRFSKDKSPYNTHVHISWAPDKGASSPAWMFGLSSEYLTLGCGVFEFDKEAMLRFRTMVAGTEGAVFAKMLSKLEKDGVRLSEAALKRVPAGFDKDHERADLLRHKGLAGWIDLSGPQASTSASLVDDCMFNFKRLRPLYDSMFEV